MNHPTRSTWLAPVLRAASLFVGPLGALSFGALSFGALSFGALSFGALSFGALCAGLPAQQRITIKGSDTMVNLNREFATRYRESHPDTPTVVVFGLGSETGIAALLNNTTDIAAASRRMTTEELQRFEQKVGRRPREVVVALDGIGVYVHNNNPVGRLTVQQLAGILDGSIRSWREVGGINRPIQVYNRDRRSGTRTFVQDHVMGGKPFGPGAQDVASSAALTATVARNQGGVGYSGIAYAQGTHILRIASGPGAPAVWPTPDNVASGRYPLSRPLYFYLHPTHVTPQLEKFIAWVLGPDGQRAVQDVGFYRAPAVQPSAAGPPTEAAGTNARADGSGGDGDGPVIPPGVVLVDPESMQRHGFRLTVTVDDGDPTLQPDQVRVTVRFDPKGASILRVRELSLRLADVAEVPVTIGRDYTVRWVLKRGWIGRTSLELAEAGAPLDGRIYAIPLAGFIKG